MFMENESVIYSSIAVLLEQCEKLPELWSDPPPPQSNAPEICFGMPQQPTYNDNNIHVQHSMTSYTSAAPGAYVDNNLFHAPPQIDANYSPIDTSIASQTGAAYSMYFQDCSPYETNWQEVASNPAPITEAPWLEMNGAPSPALHNYSTAYSHLQPQQFQETSISSHSVADAYSMHSQDYNPYETNYSEVTSNPAPMSHAPCPEMNGAPPPAFHNYSTAYSHLQTFQDTSTQTAYNGASTSIDSENYNPYETNYTEVASRPASLYSNESSPRSEAPWLDMYQSASPSLQNNSTAYLDLQPLHFQDNFKSMLPGKSDGQQPPQLPSLTSQKRRSTCECPNCAEIDSLGPAGMHVRKYNHSCHIPGCGKVFVRTSRLKAHLRRHTGERPFVCNWSSCEKRYMHSDNLQRHLRTHTGDKRLACKICSKRFTRSYQLSKHEKTHTSPKGEKKTGSSSGSCLDSDNSLSDPPHLGPPLPLGDLGVALGQPQHP